VYQLLERAEAGTTNAIVSVSHHVRFGCQSRLQVRRAGSSAAFCKDGALAVHDGDDEAGLDIKEQQATEGRITASATEPLVAARRQLELRRKLGLCHCYLLNDVIIICFSNTLATQ
jgi:hypothetical protein